MSPSNFQQSNTPGGRKRKADDDDLRDERMSASPTNSPNVSSQNLPSQHRPIKKARSGVVGRPLTLPRLLETLNVEQLRGVLKNICEQNPSIGAEVVKSAPRPTVGSALAVLKSYENTLRGAFPFGPDQSSDYSFNRVRPQLNALLEALSDFTPHFLPPNETQAAQSLNYLDEATSMLHRLPNWHSFQNNLVKQNAYEEMAKAWTSMLKESSKKAGGIHLQYEGWDKKLAKHNEMSAGKMQMAINELQNILGWTAGQNSAQQGGNQAPSEEIAQLRQELFSGTYGNQFQVRVGPW